MGHGHGDERCPYLRIRETLVRPREWLIVLGPNGRQPSPQARCEKIGENRPENRGEQHQRQHDVEHPIVDQPLVSRVEGIVGNERRGERRRHLRQRQRPDRQPLARAADPAPRPRCGRSSAARRERRARASSGSLARPPHGTVAKDPQCAPRIPVAHAGRCLHGDQLRCGDWNCG